MKIFFSVGEPSGDLHGANLIRELHQDHPEWQMVGYGGPRMATAGCQLHADLTQFAVMWVAQVLLHIHRFLGLLRRADRYFQRQRPDLVVLIDYPGFNWWIARRAKAHGIPVVYYGTPQLWAWASWRVKKIRRYVDHVLCKLPFEPKWFAQHGCQATFVGHPYFDELHGQKLDAKFLRQLAYQDGPLVTILPGSRTQEIRSNMQTFLRAARKIRQQVPQVRFAVAVFKPAQENLVCEIIHDESTESGETPLYDLMAVHVGRTPELIHAANCCMACSGSVSLELLFHAKPTVVLYHISRFAYLVQLIFRKVRYITLVNLLTADDPFVERAAGIYDPEDPRDAHVLMPEYLTCQDKSVQIASHVELWLTDDKRRQQTVNQLMELKTRLGQGGASRRAAQYIGQLLESRKLRVQSPELEKVGSLVPRAKSQGIGEADARTRKSA
jgi:lipid-A-disaccharide synthase